MKKTRIGWIGTGVMGKSMAKLIIASGYDLAVYNRTKGKTQELLKIGAVWCNTPAEVALNCDVLFTIVGYPKDVESVYFGAEGIFETIKEGTLLIDMTTTLPSLSLKIDELATSKGCQSIDAPVSGGDVGAKNGTLSIMAGGDKAAIAKAMPFFKILGSNIIHCGPTGMGQNTKMCNQITIAGTMIGVCESLLYAHKAGLNENVMLSAISGGAAACWSLNNMAPRIIKRNFEPGFYVDHFVKDMEIALDESRRMNLSMPGLSLVHQLYKGLQAQGYGKKGTQALSLALENLSGIELR